MIVSIHVLPAVALIYRSWMFQPSENLMKNLHIIGGLYCLINCFFITFGSNLMHLSSTFRLVSIVSIEHLSASLLAPFHTEHMALGSYSNVNTYHFWNHIIIITIFLTLTKLSVNLETSSLAAADACVQVQVRAGNYCHSSPYTHQAAAAAMCIILQGRRCCCFSSFELIDAVQYVSVRRDETRRSGCYCPPSLIRGRFRAGCLAANLIIWLFIRVSVGCLAPGISLFWWLLLCCTNTRPTEETWVSPCQIKPSMRWSPRACKSNRFPLFQLCSFSIIWVHRSSVALFITTLEQLNQERLSGGGGKRLPLARQPVNLSRGGLHGF